MYNITPLLAAVYEGHRDCVEYLVAQVCFLCVMLVSVCLMLMCVCFDCTGLFTIFLCCPVYYKTCLSLLIDMSTLSHICCFMLTDISTISHMCSFILTDENNLTYMLLYADRYKYNITHV